MGGGYKTPLQSIHLLQKKSIITWPLPLIYFIISIS